MEKQRLFLNKNLHILFTVTLIAVMGVTSIAPAFPKISRELGISSARVGLLITVFTFPGIFLSPVMGVMADRLGRKTVLVPSLLLFGIAGTACTFTHDFAGLLILRFFQGIGAASIASLNQTIIGDVFTGKDRIQAMGYNATVLSFGTALYPAIGGAIALLGWHYPFLLSLFAFPVAFLVARTLESPEPENTQDVLDYLKSALHHMRGADVIGLYFASSATFILLYGVLLSYFPFYLKSTYDATSFSIGIIISSASIGTALGSSNIRYLNKRFSIKQLIITAFLLYGTAIVLTLVIKTLLLLLVPVMLYGFANGINMPAAQTALSNSAPMEYRGAFMSLNGMVLRLGQTLGPVLTGLSFALWGLPGVFYSALIFIACTIFILAFLLKSRPENP
ncbi:MAG: MFS transporter [Spirochaetae bacterium HGW-Spirochaetae-1]|jgi:MFS family permease|nr:MAG: MFS transporter [Spirochaetae bacterium HGW-Spirochaetae-1]